MRAYATRLAQAALTGASCGARRVRDMPLVIQALLSIAIAIIAVVALVSLAGPLADVAAGIVVSVAVLVFTHAIMAVAAEPGEKRRRSGRPR